MKSCGTDAGRDAIAVGRQLRVVLLEHVQPLGSPLYSVIRTAQLVLPLPPCEGAGARLGLVAHPVDPLGESYVALVVLQVSVIELLEEPSRGFVPAASGHIVIRVPPGLQAAVHCLWAATALHSPSVPSPDSALCPLQGSCVHPALLAPADLSLQTNGCQGTLRPAAAQVCTRPSRGPTRAALIHARYSPLKRGPVAARPSAETLPLRAGVPGVSRSGRRSGALSARKGRR